MNDDILYHQNVLISSSIFSYFAHRFYPNIILSIDQSIYIFIQRFNKTKINMSDIKSQEGIEFQIKINVVKIKIKFPCKMQLDHAKQQVTREVSPAEPNKFVFNQSISLKGDVQAAVFQLAVVLLTEKGTKFTSGVIKLVGTEMLRCKGQRLIIPLTRCLDSDAFCEIIVEGVVNMKDSQLKASRGGSKVLQSPQKIQILSPSPDGRKISSQRLIGGETRSQANFQPDQIFTLGSEQGRYRETGPKSQIYKTFTKSPNSKYSNIKYVTYNGNLGVVKSQFIGQENPSSSYRVNFAETQVYREGYQKLKQKFKKESQFLKEQTKKRTLLQTNENNLKIEIMKYKLKVDQQQKQISQKNQKIKHINNQLIQLQKKDLDLAYLKEECNNLERKIKLQDDNFATLERENQSLKKMMAQKSTLDQESISTLRQDLQLAKNKIEEQKYEMDLQIKAKESIIIGKTNDIKIRNDTIERQKRLIHQLEEQAENKLFQYQKSLINERNAMQLKIDEHKEKISTVINERTQISIINTSYVQQIEKLKLSIQTLQYSLKIMTEESKVLNKGIQQLKSTKDKYLELQRQYKLLEDQLVTVRKGLELGLQSKDININELISKYEEGKDCHKKAKNELEDKIKCLIGKIQELERNVDANNCLIEKNKRFNQNLAKENNSLRNQNRAMRQELKGNKKRIIDLEGDHTSFRSKYDREISNYRSLLDKYKNEKAIFQKESDNLKQKIEKLEEIKKQFEDRQSQWKLKERHYEEKLEKQSAKSKDSLAKIEAAFRDQEHTINEDNINIERLNSENQNFRKRINQFELISIKNKQSAERSKKDLRLKQEKIIFLQSQSKQRQEQHQSMNLRLKQQEAKITEKDHDLSKLKQTLAEQTTKGINKEKIIDHLGKDVTRMSLSIDELKATIRTKQISEEKYREEIKLHRQEFAKEKLKNNRLENQFDKFKESISDIIRIEFTRILSTPNTQRNTERLRESQASNSKSERSIKEKKLLDAGSLSSNLLQKLHETKTSLWKMVELNKMLKIENSKLSQVTESQTNKYEFAQLQLHRDIELLEDQMGNLINDKQVQCQNYDNLMVDLNFKIKERERDIEELRIEIEQYQAIIKGMKIDFQSNNDLNQKKVISMKATISDLNERIQYLNLNIACLQDKNHEHEERLIEQDSEIVSIKEMLIKNQRVTIDLKQNEARLASNFQILKRQYKSTQQKYIQLELMFNSQRETKDKYISMLDEEEKKCQKLNEFINGLILEKETAIKNQLEKSEENNHLENKLFQISHQKDILNEENDKNKIKIEEFKEQIKNHIKNSKNFERLLAEEKTKNSRCLQKIKERQSDLQIKREHIKDLQQKYRELRDKNYKEIRQLSSELQDKNLITANLSKELHEKILKIESQNKKVFEQNCSLTQQIEELTKQVYSERDRTEDLQLQLKRMKEEKTSIQEQLASREFILEEKNEELRKLEAFILEERIRINIIENQYQQNEKQFNRNISNLQEEYSNKYANKERDYIRKVEIIQKDNQFLAEKNKQLEEDLYKVMISKKNEEIQHEQVVKNFDDKIKKIQSERLTTILQKNNEIKNISEQSKRNLEKLKEKEAEARKIAHELEQSSFLVSQLRHSTSHLQQQHKNKEKLLEKEIENYKNKELDNRSYKETILASLHQNQVEVRKLIAQAGKKIIDNCQKTDSEKLYSIVKSLQTGVIQTMTAMLGKN